MNATPELVALVQREREHRIREDHLARLVARVRACCSPSRLDRIVDSLERMLLPATYVLGDRSRSGCCQLMG